MTAGERLESLDVLRGLAVLGILVVNAPVFAMPWHVLARPTASPFPFEGASVVLWWTMHTAFEMKFLTLFTLLFGVSIHLTGGARGDRVRGPVLRRRLGWLLVFGALHGALVWFGDILFHYALVGAVMMLCRSWPAPRLALVGTVLFAASALIAGGEGVWISPLPDAAFRIDAFRGGFAETAAMNFAIWWRSAAAQAQLFSWRTLGLMMWGLALYRSGLFHGRGGVRLHAALAAAAALALAVIGWSAAERVEAGFTEPLHAGLNANFLLSPVAALGYAGLVLWGLRTAWFRPVARLLAPVGRMAFTNYVAQSLVMTAIFFGGRGPGLFGRLDWPQWTLIVAAVWALQIAGSRLWLARFRMGPLEWAWRRLSYARPVPLLGGSLER